MIMTHPSDSSVKVCLRHRSWMPEDHTHAAEGVDDPSAPIPRLASKLRRRSGGTGWYDPSAHVIQIPPA